MQHLLSRHTVSLRAAPAGCRSGTQQQRQASAGVLAVCKSLQMGTVIVLSFITLAQLCFCLLLWDEKVSSCYVNAGVAVCMSVLRVYVLQGSNPLTQERLEDAVRVIISYQNRDGGMATYENTRSFHVLEVRAWLSAPACRLHRQSSSLHGFPARVIAHVAANLLWCKTSKTLPGHRHGQ